MLLAALPLLAGCFSMATVPVPATQPEREDTAVRGVVVRQAGGGEEVVQFSEVLETSWSPTALSIIGMLEQPDNGGPSDAVTRLFPISTMAGLRVRQLDAGKTSALIGGAFVVVAALVASVVSGTAGY